MKAMLRRKNRLMPAGRVEEAGALSARIGREIQSRSRTQLTKFDGRTDVKRMWTAVRQLSGRQQAAASVVDSVTAETLNEHYATISTDQQYVAPTPKQLGADMNPPPDYVSDWHVFRMLDSLSLTATGLGVLPAWFLRVSVPILCKHVAFLFNISLATSVVAQQWNEASITPVPKIATPTQHSDFRPISITPILTRMMERTVFRTFLYPPFLAPPPSLTFSDQFAFRPTGSMSAAIISLLHTITSLLQANPYVIVISLDFSKVFDFVRHSTLLSKMSEL